MSQTSQAVDAVKTLAAQYRGVIAMADVLEQIGSIEQATNEATVRLRTARAEVDAAEQELVAKQLAIANVSDTVAKANADAQQITQQASADAKAIRDNAALVAAQIVAEANAAVQVLAESERAYRMSISTLAAQEADAKSSLADVNAQLAAVKAQAAALAQ